MAKAYVRGIVAALALAAVSAPAAAQHYSDSYTFLKAVKERDSAKATELVNQPTVLNAKDRDSGEGALHIVVRARDYTWLSFLMSKKANLNIQNRSGETPLNIAAQIGWLEGAELLLTWGASVDLPNGRGETPLIMAVHQRNLAMVRLLLSKGANPTKVDSAAGYSAIDYARQDSRSAAILRLLEAPRTPAKPAAGPKL